MATTFARFRASIFILAVAVASRLFAQEDQAAIRSEAAPSANATASVAIVNLTDTSAAVLEAPGVTPAVRPFKFKAVASGDYWPGSFTMRVRTPPEGSGWGGGPFPDRVITADSMTAWIDCLAPGSYEVITEVVKTDGNGVYAYLPFEVPNTPPLVKIANVEPLPGTDQYRVHVQTGAQTGQRLTTWRYQVYPSLAGGGFGPPVTTFFSNVISGKRGDKVVVAVYSCMENFGADEMIIPAPASIEVAVLSGNGQKAVVGEAAAQPLRVKFTASDPSVDLTGLTATFQITSVPTGASGYAVAATDGAGSSSYSVPVAADGTASAVFIAGDLPGAYVVRVESPRSATGLAAVFTTTGVKPAAVAIVKDTTDLADAADAYAVSASDPTSFSCIGLDAARQKIGPIKCNWTTSASGSPKTRGAGTVSPAVAAKTTVFQPSTAGKLRLTAASPIKGVKSGSTDLFLTSLYVSVQNTFVVTDPVDDSARFVPGMYLDGTNVSMSVMETSGQFISLHLITGGAKGKATFTVDSSSYPGIAMNYPLDGSLSKDMQFTNGQQSTTVDFNSSTGDTWTTLLIRDFGASGTINVSIQSGKKTYQLKTLKLPQDLDANGLPDEPWKIGGNVINPAGLTATSDDDDDGNPATPHKGDGLSAFEEMRGMVATGVYTRLDPRRRDVFLVADQELLAFGSLGGSASPISYFTPLPVWNHYLELTEVAGDDYPSRRLTKIKPVVNPNRVGVPGSTLNGQRAVRAIQQTEFWPSVTVFIPAGGGAVEQDVPVWQYGVFGATVLDTTSVDEIDRTQSGQLVTNFAAGSPNETSFVEWYAKTFENAGVHTEFTDGLVSGFHDEFGNAVPPCLSPNDVGCDVWEDRLIVPRELPGGILDELHTVPEYAGDYYTRRAFTCSDFTNDLPGGMSLSAFTNLKAAVVAHEVGHALHLDHQPQCGSLMFDMTLFGIRRGMSDIDPIPLSFGPTERDAIRLHE